MTRSCTRWVSNPQESTSFPMAPSRYNSLRISAERLNNSQKTSRASMLASGFKFSRKQMSNKTSPSRLFHSLSWRRAKCSVSMNASPDSPANTPSFVKQTSQWCSSYQHSISSIGCVVILRPSGTSCLRMQCTTCSSKLGRNSRKKLCGMLSMRGM